jgi:hypothetical protein
MRHTADFGGLLPVFRTTRNATCATAETQAARCLVAHVLTPGSSELLDAPVAPWYFTLPASNPCSDKSKPCETRGHKATGPRLLRDAGVVDATRDPRPPSYRTKWPGGRFLSGGEGRVVR